MEERSAERTRIKAEREERRRKAEEERLAQLEAEEAARLREIEEEKRKRAEAYREKKRLEKQVILLTFLKILINHAMSIPDFCLCKNKGADQLCSNSF